MLLQLAEGTPQNEITLSYIHLPRQKVNVRADYFDRMPLKEMAETLAENGYSLAEISELSAKRAQRRAAAPSSAQRKTVRKTEKAARPKQMQKAERKAAKTAVIKARATKKADKGTARILKGQAKKIKAQRRDPSEREELFKTIVDTAAQSFAPETEQEQFAPEFEQEQFAPEFEQEQFAPEFDQEQNEFTPYENIDQDETDMAELSADKKARRKKLVSAITKGATTAVQTYTKGTTKAPIITQIQKDIRQQARANVWNETLFNIGNIKVTKQAAAIGGGLLLVGGLAMKKGKK
jgi:hypothetical protein